MVHPLIHDNEGTFHLSKVGNGVLSQHSDPIGGNKLRNAVVDLRIHMVRTSCQNNASPAGFIQIF